MALSNKHQTFVDQYFLHRMNGTDAYMAAYPKASYDTARANAAKLLANTSIQEEIRRRLTESHMSADEVLTRLSDLARVDMSDFITFEDGIRLPFVDLKKAKDAGKLHLVKKLKYNAQGHLEFELHDPIQPLLNVGKHLGLFNNGPGSSENEPFILKVIYGERTNHTPETTPPPAE